MKKIFALFTAVCFGLSACIPGILQPQATNPAPVIPDIQSTVAAQVEQTLQSLPSPTLAPSNTPVVITATSAPTQTAQPPTLTATQIPTLPTLTVTLGVGTPSATATLNPVINATPTETAHYQYYGTMPPNIAYRADCAIQQVKSRRLHLPAMYHSRRVCDDHRVPCRRQYDRHACSCRELCLCGVGRRPKVYREFQT